METIPANIKLQSSPGFVTINNEWYILGLPNLMPEGKIIHIERFKDRSVWEIFIEEYVMQRYFKGIMYVAARFTTGERIDEYNR